MSIKLGKQDTKISSINPIDKDTNGLLCRPEQHAMSSQRPMSRKGIFFRPSGNVCTNTNAHVRCSTTDNSEELSMSANVVTHGSTVTAIRQSVPESNG